jgi:hypothetical protein
MDSLYVPQWSPIAVLRAVYSGSRSILGGTWPVFEDDFGTAGTDELTVFGGNIGVVEITGRLRAVGSISPGIFESRAFSGLYSATCGLIKVP